MQRIVTIDLTLALLKGEPQHKDVESLGPFFQGALMELIDPLYASRLHQLPFNPYSQYIKMDDEMAGKLKWHVSILTDETASKLMTPLMGLSSIRLRALDIELEVTKTQIEQVPLKSLTDMIYSSAASRVSIRFLTPTAFKSKGEYIIVPSTRLIFQNLLMRYEQVYSGSKEIDFETIDYLEAHTRITSYGLKSRYFANVGSSTGKIPAFVGGMSLFFSGPSTVAGLANMLLAFGTYSGVGIKTAMGMGAMSFD